MQHGSVNRHKQAGKLKWVHPSSLVVFPYTITQSLTPPTSTSTCMHMNTHTHTHTQTHTYTHTHTHTHTLTHQSTHAYTEPKVTITQATEYPYTNQLLELDRCRPINSGSLTPQLQHIDTPVRVLVWLVERYFRQV